MGVIGWGGKERGGEGRLVGDRDRQGMERESWACTLDDSTV